MSASSIRCSGGSVRASVIAHMPIPYVLRRSGRSRRLRITIDQEHGLVVTVPARDAAAAGPTRSG